MSSEAEVKYRVHDGDALLRALADRGVVLSAPALQDDQAYAPGSWREGDNRIGVTFIRLRIENGVCTFTTKTPVDNLLACREHETVVLDREQMHQAILAMGYRPTVRVVKTRRIGRVGNFTLCLDEIPGVGQFFEVEALGTGTGGMLLAQAEMAAWAAGLGVGLDRTTATYDQVVGDGAERAVPATTTA